MTILHAWDGRGDSLVRGAALLDGAPFLESSVWSACAVASVRNTGRAVGEAWIPLVVSSQSPRQPAAIHEGPGNPSGEDEQRTERHLEPCHLGPLVCVGRWRLPRSGLPVLQQHRGFPGLTEVAIGR
jgi:hypothetical protein